MLFVVFERSLDPALDPAFETVIVRPSYRLALGLGAIAFSLAWLNRWVGLGLGVFALFLALQATILRLHFTASALDLYRGQTRLRHFPYADWTHWEIFWPSLPILFYFNEVNNIHFLPMLFNAQQLRDCATARCPRLPERNASAVGPAASAAPSSEGEIMAPGKSPTAE